MQTIAAVLDCGVVVMQLYHKVVCLVSGLSEASLMTKADATSSSSPRRPSSRSVHSLTICSLDWGRLLAMSICVCAAYLVASS